MRSKKDETLFLLALCKQALACEEGLLLKADNPALAALKIYRLRGYHNVAKCVKANALAHETEDGGNLIITKRDN